LFKRLLVVEPMGSEVYLYLNSGAHAFIAQVAVAEKKRMSIESWN